MTNGKAHPSDDFYTDDAMQHLIGQQLRAVYDEVLAEPIPLRLVQLLQQLDEVTSDKSSKGS